MGGNHFAITAPVFFRYRQVVVDRLAARIVARYLEAQRPRLKVRNKDTGKIQWKTPEALKNTKHPERYEKVPQEHDREPQGRPRVPANPGVETLPGPPPLPEPPKPPKPPKPAKPPVPVPVPEPLELPRPPHLKPAPGQEWKRHDDE